MSHKRNLVYMIWYIKIGAQETRPSVGGRAKIIFFNFFFSIFSKRDLAQEQKSPSIYDLVYQDRSTRDLRTLETECKDKRDLVQRQKRPSIQAKETQYRCKRDLVQRQKRPSIEAKETYYRGKRDLGQRQKRPNDTSIPRIDAKQSLLVLTWQWGVPGLGFSGFSLGSVSRVQKPSSPYWF